MFGVGSGELLVVFVIGLIVLGPERLPKVAAQVGRWVARARRMANQLRYQLEQEIALEELRAKNEELRTKNEELHAKNAEAPKTEEAADAEGEDAATSAGASEPMSSAQAEGSASGAESVASAEAENDAVPPGRDTVPAAPDAVSAVEEADLPLASSSRPANVRPLGSAIPGTAPPRELRPIEVGEDEAEIVTAEAARSGKTGAAE